MPEGSHFSSDFEGEKLMLPMSAIALANPAAVAVAI
jgi:hypothetical protein